MTEWQSFQKTNGAIVDRNGTDERPHIHRWQLTWPDATAVHCADCATSIRSPESRYPEALAEAREAR